MSASLRAIIIVTLLLTLAVALQVWRDRGWQPYQLSTPVMWLQASPAIKRAALGFDSLIADVYWTRTVVYFGRQRLAEGAQRNYDLLYPLLDLVTTLDPRFTAAYRFGAVFLAEPPPGGPGRPDLAIQLLQRGLAATPERWEYFHGIAFVEYWSHRNYTAAAEWLERAARIDGSPIWLKSSAALMRQQTGDRAAARVLWRQLHDSTDDRSLKNLAQMRIAQFDAMDAIDQLNEQLWWFEAATGKTFTRWEQLIEAGMLPVVPVDPTGVPYVLDLVHEDVRLSEQSPLWPLPTGLAGSGQR